MKNDIVIVVKGNSKAGKAAALHVAQETAKALSDLDAFAVSSTASWPPADASRLERLLKISGLSILVEEG